MAFRRWWMVLTHCASRLQPLATTSLALALLLLPATAPAETLTETTKLFQAGKYEECVAVSIGELELTDFSKYQEGHWLLKIQGELELGRYPDALNTLNVALESIPNSLQLRWVGRDVCRLNQDAPRALKLEGEMTTLLKEFPWRYTDSANQIIVGRWMLSQRADAKKVLSSVYNEAKRQRPTVVDIWLAIGDLGLEKHDYQLAGEAFQQAAKLEAENADAQFGIAQAFAPSDSERAETALKAALVANPRHIPSLLFIANEQIDSESYDDADKTLAQVMAINARHPLALAYKAVLAHLRNQPEKEREFHAEALKTWPENPEVDHLIGRKLSQKYRFAEGAEYQRQAIKFDPQHLPAKSQLAQDLLRLGKEEEGLKLAEEVYTADAYNIFAHNLVTLQESLAKFRTLEADGIIVRMEAKEAEVYGQRVLNLLRRAKTVMSKKYDIQLTQPIIVEMFPRQQDFAIRTFGLPGGAGFLGVCFGTVITANSPASQGTSPSNWEATLWHEFCHVITLSKTKNKMPRWLSEGISVYEERLADPTWGQTINPRYREMMLGDDLTPVSQLSGAFLHPKSAVHLQFAYFESSLVVQYLVEKYGQETLQRVLVDLGAGLPINESLQRYTGSLAALDAEFATYARDKAKKFAPKADWTTPELPRRPTEEVIQELLKEHPNNYAALTRLAATQIVAKQWDAAKATLAKMLALYPEDGTSTSPYALLAKVYRETKENKKEREVLEKLAGLNASDLTALDRLCDLTAAAGDWPLAKKYVLRALAVNPLLPAVQRRAATVAEKTGDTELALESYRALLVLDPFGAAETHYQLATVLHKQKKLVEAKRHVLLALEETPRYRAAQELLLQIVAAMPPVVPPVVPPATPPADKPPAAASEPKP